MKKGLGLTVAVLCLLVGWRLWARYRPEPPLDYAATALGHPDFTWDSIRAGGFTLYTVRGSYGAARAPQYRDEVASAMVQSLAMLGEPRYPAHLRVFVMGSREDVEKIDGTPTLGWGDAAGRTVGVVALEGCRPVFRHEVMHAVSLLVWGNPLGPDGDPNAPRDSARMSQGGWLREGIAAAAENLYGKYTYRGMSAQWQAEGGLMPIDTLVHSFYYRKVNLAAYLHSGSLVMYLLEKYRPEQLRAVWREGPGAFPRAYGKSAAAIETEWHEWLRATPASERPKSIAIARAEDGCPGRPATAARDGKSR